MEEDEKSTIRCGVDVVDQMKRKSSHKLRIGPRTHQSLAVVRKSHWSKSELNRLYPETHRRTGLELPIGQNYQLYEIKIFSIPQ